MRGFKLLHLIGAEHGAFDKGLRARVTVERKGNPVKALQIAQATLPFLDMRLEQVARIALAAMAGVALFKLGADKAAAMALRDGADPRIQLRKSGVTAPDGTHLKGGCQDRMVTASGAGVAFKVMHRMADLELKIPEAVEQGLNKSRDFRLGTVAEKEQIQVRAGTQLTPAKATLRHQGKL